MRADEHLGRDFTVGAPLSGEFGHHPLARTPARPLASAFATAFCGCSRAELKSPGAGGHSEDGSLEQGVGELDPTVGAHAHETGRYGWGEADHIECLR